MSKPTRVTRLHRRIKELREAAGLTQEALAIELGMHKTAISHWETGHSAPRAGDMARVAKALKVEIAALYEAA